MQRITPGSEPKDGAAMIRWASSDKEGIGQFPVASYPGGEPLIVFPRNKSVSRVMVKADSMLEFMAGMFFADALAERGNPPIELVLPFIPGARQDRLNEEGDFLFTAKSVSKEINARNFRTVTVLDPHSDVVPALVDRCRVIRAHECLRFRDPSRDEYAAVISPDAGAEKRAGAVARDLKVPLLHGWKTRDVETGKISGFGMEYATGYPDGRVLVVDDICDGGGTFLGLADVIREDGLWPDLYVTHGIFSQGTEKLLERYGRIYCTDSVDAERPGVEVIPVCDALFGKVGEELR